MAKWNLDENTLVYQAIAPASTALTGVYSSAIDTLNYSGALVIVNAGLAATSAELDVTVREGSARTVSTTHTHVTGASFTQIVPANDNAVYVGWLDLQPRERYISVKFARDGTNDVTAGCVVVLSKKQYLPTTQVATVAFNILT
jgi:hypothetical protein